MQLSDDLFEAIVGSGSINVDSGRKSERRNRGRIRLPARVQIIPMPQNVAGKPVSVQVRDLSPHGIGFLMPGKLRQGDALLVRLQAPDATTWILCDVARIEKVGPELFVVGATFTRLVERGKTPAPAGAPALRT